MVEIIDKFDFLTFFDMGDALSARDKLFGMLFDTDSDVFIDILKKGLTVLVKAGSYSWLRSMIIRRIITVA